MQKLIDRLLNQFKETDTISSPIYQDLLLSIHQFRANYRSFIDSTNFVNQTDQFVKRFKEGETVEVLLPEAFALVMEAFFRVYGITINDMQLCGAITLHYGEVAEMKTGEGKTCIAVFAAYLNALPGDGVHIVTLNEYLAVRDSEEMGVVFRYLGMEVGCIQSEISVAERQKHYQCPVTYSTHYEIGFDYLRDHLVTNPINRVLRPLNYAIIDEIDSILVDEARTPLIISSPPGKGSNYLYYINDIVQRLVLEVDYERSELGNLISLTSDGISKSELLLSIDNLMSEANSLLYHYLYQSLQANYGFQKDIDYILAPNEDGQLEVVIVDQNTGRLMHGRRFNEGLHQAIEAKERVGIQGSGGIMGTITLQSFFKLYEVISGMTGTAFEAKEELESLYGLSTLAIPTHKPTIRIDYGDIVFYTEAAKYQAIVQDISTRHTRGQPILVGTQNIKQSERLARLLEAAAIPHYVLNAKNHQEEAEIVAAAGHVGAVTISTSMAGRGVDIKLDAKVKELGGLHVIGASRFESSRIDNQLRGRSGRQGDEGSSIFYVSLEDDLMIRYASDEIYKDVDPEGVIPDTPLERRKVKHAINNAQRTVESLHAQMRKQLLMYNHILSLQRRDIYHWRDEVLVKEDLGHIAGEMTQRVIVRFIDSYCPIEEPMHVANDWNLTGLLIALSQNIPISEKLIIANLYSSTKSDLMHQFTSDYRDKFAEKYDDVLYKERFRQILLGSIDRNWTEYLEAVEGIKNGIHLKAYGHTDPLIDYEREVSGMYERLIQSIEQEAVKLIWQQMRNKQFATIS